MRPNAAPSTSLFSVSDLASGETNDEGRIPTSRTRIHAGQQTLSLGGGGGLHRGVGDRGGQGVLARGFQGGGGAWGRHSEMVREMNQPGLWEGWGCEKTAGDGAEKVTAWVTTGGLQRCLSTKRLTNLLTDNRPQCCPSRHH